MIKTLVISLLCLFISISFGIGNRANKYVTILHKGISHIILNERSLQPDQGEWLTLRAITNDGQYIDTIDQTHAIFDSSSFGLDADTCWIDSLIMEKTYDSTSGYTYLLDNFSGFHYSPNHRFLLQAQGTGSVPQLTDTIRSPIHAVQVTHPHLNDTIIRGDSMVINWTPQNENNIYIQLIDTTNNYLLYFPLDDIGTFTIPAFDIDSLVSGQLAFMIGRMNFALSFPGYLFLTLCGNMNASPLELQDAPGIEEIGENARIDKVNSPFATSCITYSQSRASTLQLEIFDVTGKKIRDIKEQGHLEGTISWDKKDKYSKLVSKGIYIYRLQTADKDFYGKFVILR
jgi:hypothetical protein